MPDAAVDARHRPQRTRRVTPDPPLDDNGAVDSTKINSNAESATRDRGESDGPDREPA